jgi:hypothetical protein
MSSEIKADKWSPASGTAGTIGDSGDTFTLTAGANLTLGGSSTTVTVPSGATLDVASGATFDATGATVTGISGGLVYLGGTTFSSNVADIDLDHFSSDYMIHKVYGTISGDTAGQDYYLQWRNGGSDDSSNVYITSIGTNLQENGSTTSTTDYGAWNGTYMPFVSGSITSNTTPPRFEMTVYNAMSTAYNPALSFTSMYYRTGNQWAVSTGTMYFNDGGGNSMEGIRLYPSANNFDKGEVRVYGVVNS